MPSLSHAGLVDEIQNAVSSSGYAIMRLSETAAQPERFLVSGPDIGSLQIWVYIKNFTPAFRSDPDEYRIQIRGELVPLQMNPSGPTVLLGYHADSGLFIGFDTRTVSDSADTQLSAGYASLRQMKKARRNGMSFDKDRIGRIAVGIRPEMLVAYCLNADEIHDSDGVAIIRVLNKSASEFQRTDARRVSVKGEEKLPANRQRLVRNINVLARDAGFRNRILEAYDMRCAVTGAQLGLVEAAHILPVSAKGSTDRTDNGLALLPHLHRAFDSGLIYLTSKRVMRLNDSRVEELQEENLVDGLELVSGALGEIVLPRSKKNWPDPTMIRAANRSRGIRA